MLTREHRRSGISSLIGAIFFVLVVFLVFSSTVIIFENFTGYALSFKNVDSQDVQAKNTMLSVQDLAFGGVSTGLATETLQSLPNSASESLLPIENMNFTNNMDGWVFSRGYELSLHNGTVTNYPESILPGLDVFTMTVFNQDTLPPIPSSIIVAVSLIINSGFKVPPAYDQPAAPAGWNDPTVTGNTITWTVNSACTGISAPPTSSAIFRWAAVAPTTLGSYSHDVTLTWEDVTGCPAVAQDQGTTALTNTVVTTIPPPTLNTQTAQIAAVPNTTPGGSFGGYDPISSNIGSESGPGSAYLSFQPTFNGEPISVNPQGVADQLTSAMNFTTYFSLPAPVTLNANSYGMCSVTPTSCPVLSFGYSVDHAVSGEPPLVFISVYLTRLPTALLTVGVKEIVNSTTLNIDNNGWFMNDTAFDLYDTGPTPIEAAGQPGVLPAGQYELSVEVKATLFGATAPSANYPASLLMHLDDIGLAFPEAAASSWCVDTAATGASPCADTPLTAPQTCVPLPQPPAPTTASCGLFATLPAIGGTTFVPGELQSLTFNAAVSVSSPGGGASPGEVTAYAYLEDVQASPPTAKAAWVELGQVTFTSSADIQATIPGSSASEFLDEYGGLCTNYLGADPAGSACIRIYATSASGYNFGSLSVNATIVAQTFKQEYAALFVSNNGTEPVHIVSVYVSGVSGLGVGGVWSTTTGSTLPLGGGAAGMGPGIWVGSGETTAIQMGQASVLMCNSDPTSIECFSWTSGQTYVVTVTTDKGLVFTGTFLAP